MITAEVLFTLPVLAYGMGALAPQISEETMNYHYGKHLHGYIDNLNNLTKDTKWEGATLEDLIRHSDGPIFNNAAQTWNHIFFFNTLSPNPKSVPTGVLSEAVNRSFDDFDSMKQALLTSATSLFGSGWVWLVKDKHSRLSIIAESNAGNPLRVGLTPLMCLDVWEHAYYIDYRNRRAEAVKAMLDRIDWRVVEDRFIQSGE